MNVVNQTNIMSSRKVDVTVAFPEMTNDRLTKGMNLTNPTYVKAIRKALQIKDNESIPFFTKGKSYPVLGFYFKSEMKPVTQDSRTIQIPGQSGPVMTYNEFDFVILPDDFGGLQYVERNVVRISGYEVTDKYVEWKSVKLNINAKIGKIK